MVPVPRKKLPNVLVVCHGNICRSPLAGVVLVRASIPVRSRGFVNPGRLAAKKVREYASRLGYSLDSHRSVIITTEDVQWADVIVYMDGGNRKRIVAQFPDAYSKCVCLATCVGLSRIADPNYLPRGNQLNRLLDLIVAAAKKFGHQVQRKTPGEGRGLHKGEVNVS